MYATDGRTDGRTKGKFTAPLSYGWGHNNHKKNNDIHDMNH